jgi:hypothetical protein
MKLLSKRTSPLFIEHFDAWLTLGVRAGGDLCLAMAVTPTRQLQTRIEDEVLSMAAQIVRARHGKT